MNAFQEFLSNSKKSTKAATVQAEGVVQRKRRILDLPVPPPFYINKLPLLNALPPETKRWIRDATDERAAIEYGCRFVESRGQYTVRWIESNCILYEGHNAGDFLTVDDWQYEFFMQVFGWLWFSKDWALKTGREDLGWVRRFRKVRGWVPKKNTKSPTLAATGLYCLIADGERGQKCFSIAKDVNQALLAHTHAVQFVNQNPTLKSVCKVNKTTNAITYLPTNSVYSIRTGATSNNRDRNEGLNGNLFTDEGHVVDEKQMGILDRAGISRRQFLDLCLSTAGSNIAGWGYKQWEFGRANIELATSGKPFDFRFKHLEFSIEPDVSFDDLRDPTKIDGFIKQANPTLGRIVMSDEIKQDWFQSCRSDTELARFAMYRLNQWNQSGGAYIAGSDWAKCAKRYRYADVKQYPCVVGGDFSRRRDMTALMLMFAVPTKVVLPIDPFDELTEWEEKEINVPHIFPFFFIPERAVRMYDKYIDLKEYESAGLLTITKGATIRAEEIAQKLAAIESKFDLRKVGTDSFYAKDVAAVLDSQYGWDIESKFGLISQTAANIGPAVEQLLNCVLNKEIAHPNNAILNWQLSNIAIIEDTNGNRRFEKPTSDNYRKIDGWSALANGIYCMMCDPELYPGQVISVKV